MITTDDFHVRCGCRSVDECFCNMGAGTKALEALVRKFGKPMMAKLRRKYMEGFHGWDDPKKFPDEILEQKLREHAERPLTAENVVDIANFCAMIWNRGQ